MRWLRKDHLRLEVQSSISHRIYSDCSRASGKEEQEQKDMLTCQTSSRAVAPHKKAKRESLLLIHIYLV
ncbi:hypothetical protein KY285_000220 [Solanum tuberosum]|nr:hypothetical protein KY284_000244 [Solanum tuberosum]KAH0764349.1 hypothetical protein KY285_000220 [Solanum tuberosum]